MWNSSNSVFEHFKIAWRKLASVVLMLKERSSTWYWDQQDMAYTDRSRFCFFVTYTLYLAFLHFFHLPLKSKFVSMAEQKTDRSHFCFFVTYPLYLAFLLFFSSASLIQVCVCGWTKTIGNKCKSCETWYTLPSKYDAIKQPVYINRSLSLVVP